MSAPSSGATYPSVIDAPPLNTGGIAARIGFSYQDHIGASICLEMLHDSRILQVLFETQDDILMLWHVDGQTYAEYVQVKSDSLSQMWSITRLCSQLKDSTGKAKSQSSILERSLQYDQFKEISKFRIVTAVGVAAELNVLTLPMFPPNPSVRDVAKTNELKLKIAGQLPGAKSIKKNGTDYWVDNCSWNVAESLEAVENKNKLALRRLLDKQGYYLVSDQLDEIYLGLVARVKAASESVWARDPSKKTLERGDLHSWVLNKADQYLNTAKEGGKLARKLTDIGLGETDILGASELRLLYLSEQRKPTYMTPERSKRLSSEVKARLHLLRIRLLNGALQLTGLEFLERCTQELEDLRHRLGDPAPDASYMQGAMYDIANRCLHRWDKAP